jgi:hypothetical protein
MSFAANVRNIGKQLVARQLIERNSLSDSRFGLTKTVFTACSEQANDTRYQSDRRRKPVRPSIARLMEATKNWNKHLGVLHQMNKNPRTPYVRRRGVQFWYLSREPLGFRDTGFDHSTVSVCKTNKFRYTYGFPVRQGNHITYVPRTNVWTCFRENCKVLDFQFRDLMFWFPTGIYAARKALFSLLKRFVMFYTVNVLTKPGLVRTARFLRILLKDSKFSKVFSILNRMDLRTRKGYLVSTARRNRVLRRKRKQLPTSSPRAKKYYTLCRVNTTQAVKTEYLVNQGETLIR